VLVGAAAKSRGRQASIRDDRAARALHVAPQAPRSPTRGTAVPRPPSGRRRIQSRRRARRW